IEVHAGMLTGHDANLEQTAPCFGAQAMCHLLQRLVPRLGNAGVDGSGLGQRRGSRKHARALPGHQHCTPPDAVPCALHGVTSMAEMKNASVAAIASMTVSRCNWVKARVLYVAIASLSDEN